MVLDLLHHGLRGVGLVRVLGHDRGTLDEVAIAGNGDDVAVVQRHGGGEPHHSLERHPQLQGLLDRPHLGLAISALVLGRDVGADWQ